MAKRFFIAPVLFFSLHAVFAAELSPAKEHTKPPVVSSTFTPFTGKTLGNNVRVRAKAALDSSIVCELGKGDYVIVKGQKGDFYAIVPPSQLKAYIFRGFVIDGVVEADRVNIRLAPNREAPIVGRYNKGAIVEEAISANHPKWLEIPFPQTTRFYIAKEYIEYAGDVTFKEKYEARKKEGEQLLTSTRLLTQSEFAKPFQEIDPDKISAKYREILDHYADFPTYVAQARQALDEAQKTYLQRKIAYLEGKEAPQPPSAHAPTAVPHEAPPSAVPPPSGDRMAAVWEPIERSLYIEWCQRHPSQSIEAFYTDQKLKQATTLRGVLVSYDNDKVKNKPGDFMLKDRELPLAYLYSTRVDLHALVGKEVSLLVAPRSNNDFAFPAFYVLEVVH